MSGSDRRRVTKGRIGQYSPESACLDAIREDSSCDRRRFNVAITLRVMSAHHAERDGYYRGCYIVEIECRPGYHQWEIDSFPRRFPVSELVVMSLAAALVLVVAAYYLRWAVRTLRRTTGAFEMLPDERQFLRRQAWRRLVNSGLMLLLGVLLIGAYAGGLPQRAEEIGKQREREAVDGQKPPLTEEQRDFSQLFVAYWTAFLLLLGIIVALAGLDLMATRRYAVTQLRRIQTDRRAMLERQIARWREEGQGPSFN